MTDPREYRSVVAKCAPVVCFHEKERYFPCTPAWLFERCGGAKVEGKTRVGGLWNKGEFSVARVDAALKTLVTGGPNISLTVPDPADRAGELSAAAGSSAAVPWLAHVKEVMGACDAAATGGAPVLEINYMALHAYNGAYIGGAGAHDGDWEHLTVRCTCKGALIGVYYGAHRHRDGQWVPAAQVPLDAASGRIAAFAALNGHGYYPTAGKQTRIFGFANDQTSAKGRVWRPTRCSIVAAPGTAPVVPVVADRSVDLPPIPASGVTPQKRVVLDGCSAADPADAARTVEVEVEQPPWMAEPWLRVFWGSSAPPPRQDWFGLAEHPTGSNATRRLVPCA